MVDSNLPRQGGLSGKPNTSTDQPKLMGGLAGGNLPRTEKPVEKLNGHVSQPTPAKSTEQKAPQPKQPSRTSVFRSNVFWCLGGFVAGAACFTKGALNHAHHKDQLEQDIFAASEGFKMDSTTLSRLPRFEPKNN